MDYKKQIEEVLDSLKAAGFDRSRIEEDMDYSVNYIDQVLSKGGNKKFLKAMIIYRMAMLQNPTSKSNTSDDKERLIQQIESRRKDAEQMAEKMERHYEDAKADKSKLFDQLSSLQNTINDVLKPMAASLKDIPPVLEVIVRNSAEHDREIMKALDRLEGNVPGTLEQESGKRILKGALERQKKGKADVGKQS
jgi:regulator of replication initiation timing